MDAKQANDESLIAAQQLATRLWAKFWQQEKPRWKVADKIEDVQSQIDELVSGLTRQNIVADSKGKVAILLTKQAINDLVFVVESHLGSTRNHIEEDRAMRLRDISERLRQLDKELLF
jgi:hypothetical protein